MSFEEVVSAVSGPEAVFTLLDIEHASLSEPLRVVNDMQDFVHLGNTYSPLSFEVILPSQPESGMPQARLRLGNLGTELMQALLDTQGLVGSTATIKQVIRSDPDNPAFEIKLFMTDIQADQDIVDARLEFTNIYSIQCFPTTYNTTTAPGLF